MRLAPERLAERERADRQRTRLAAESGPVFEDGSPTPARRWLPAIVAGAVLLLVILVGAAVISSSHRNSAQQNFLAGGQPQGFTQNPGGYAPPVAGGPNTAEIGPGDGPMAGRPIGELPQDQSDQQRAAGDQGAPAGSGPPDVPRADVSVAPPPTMRTDNGSGPLQPVAPSPVRPGPLPVAATRADSGAAGQPARPAGRVRISVADQGGGYAPGPTAPASAASSSGSPNGYFGAPHAVGNAFPPAGSALIGAPRGGAGNNGNFPRATVAGPGSGSSRSARPASGGWTGATDMGGPRSVAATGGAGASYTPGGPSAASQASGGSYRVASGMRAPERPTVRAGQSAPSGGSRGGGSNADDLRAQARNAASSGRRDDARSLYRRAIDSYRAEAGASPGRAGASRSAIDSCQRALEAMDAGQ